MMDLRTVLVALDFLCRIVTATVLGQKEHKTPQAAEKANDLSCYVCDSMDVGSACTDLPNNMSFITKCQDDRRTCMVKQFSYSTTATGTSPDNSSWPFRRPWSLQRNCTNKCEPGCIIIGERTKLYACTACCEKSLCNNMKAVATQHGYSTLTILSVAILAFASS